MVITVTYGIVEQLVIADKEPVLHLIRRRPSHRIDDKPQVIDARRLIFKLTRDALGLTNIFLVQTVWNWQSVNRASGIRRYSVNRFTAIIGSASSTRIRKHSSADRSIREAALTHIASHTVSPGNVFDPALRMCVDGAAP